MCCTSSEAISPEKILAGYRTLIDWGLHQGIVPRATLIGMSLDDPDITPMAEYRFDWCLVLPESVTADAPGEPGSHPGRAIRRAALSRRYPEG